ncbi:MAG: lysophospholipid acyltransferase family protein [Desulfurivibrio sp.]|nr:lysophospholipid acyltransferase family protein [Desulfurivibrio sp.]
MKEVARITVFWRGVLTLTAIPLLTIIISLAAAGLAVTRGCADGRLQFLARWWGRMICRLAGVRPQVSGLENIAAARPYIFVANHQSQFDIFVLQGYFAHDFRWLAKKELFRIPLWGWAMRRAGHIAVDRGHGRQALVSLGEAAQRIAAGTSVVIFPEGTRSPDGRLQPFKAGGMVLAIKSGIEVVPVAIAGTREVLPKGSLLPRPGPVEIKIGQPVATADYHLKQKQELAGLLEERVRQLLAPPANAPHGP